jgi:hypothetical protein
MDRTVAYQ